MNISENLLRHFTEPDPKIEERIEQDIVRHRMGWGSIRLVDEENRPLAITNDCEISIRQLSHEFNFGSTLFMLDGFTEEAENDKFKQRFLQIFNHGVAPFYWKDIEPEDGKPRFSVDSKPIYRRPPPDLIVGWADANGVSLKGHPLVWDAKLFHPEYAPDDHDNIAVRLRKRIRQIGERYGEKFAYWDVVNEAICDRNNENVIMPRDRVFWSFKEAERYFPPEAKLFYNDGTTSTWLNYRPDTSWMFLLLQNLLLRGARVDGAGLQYHHFTSNPEVMNKKTDILLNPAYLLQVLDQYAQLGLELHISEITIPLFRQLPDGEELQAKLARELYRTWFSHPNVKAITWWNLVDGTAHNRVDWDQNTLYAGLLDEKLSPKAAYEALANLINNEWRTNLRITGTGAETIKFRGFYGNYEISLKQGNLSKKIYVSLRKSGANAFSF